MTLRKIIENAPLANEDWIAEVKLWQDACWGPDEAGYAKTEELTWYIVDNYPVNRIHLKGEETWQAWFADEQKAKNEDEDYGAGYYDYMLTEPIHEPIIIYDDGKSGYIWDGWHRTAATVVKNERIIKAIVGVSSET